MESIELAELNPPEKTRTYHLSGDRKLVLKDVTHFLARPSGSHRLKTADGHLWIIPAAFVSQSAIEIDVEKFTV